MKENINILYETVGRNIKKLRKSNKISQEELANFISLSRSSISNIEIGNHQPSIYVIYEICLALDCEVYDLLPSIEKYKTTKHSIEEKFNEILNSLSDDISKRNLSILKEFLRNDDK